MATVEKNIRWRQNYQKATEVSEGDKFSGKNIRWRQKYQRVTEVSEGDS